MTPVTDQTPKDLFPLYSFRKSLSQTLSSAHWIPIHVMQKLNAETLMGLTTVLVNLGTREMDTSAQVISLRLYVFYLTSMAYSFNCSSKRHAILTFWKLNQHFFKDKMPRNVDEKIVFTENNVCSYILMQLLWTGSSPIMTSQNPVPTTFRRFNEPFRL